MAGRFVTSLSLQMSPNADKIDSSSNSDMMQMRFLKSTIGATPYSGYTRNLRYCSFNASSPVIALQKFRSALFLSTSDKCLMLLFWMEGERAACHLTACTECTRRTVVAGAGGKTNHFGHLSLSIHSWQPTDALLSLRTGGYALVPVQVKREHLIASLLTVLPARLFLHQSDDLCSLLGLLDQLIRTGVALIHQVLRWCQILSSQVFTDLLHHFTVLQRGWSRFHMRNQMGDVLVLITGLGQMHFIPLPHCVAFVRGSCIRIIRRDHPLMILHCWAISPSDLIPF